jgi:hypothetical protein
METEIRMFSLMQRVVNCVLKKSMYKQGFHTLGIKII